MTNSHKQRHDWLWAFVDLLLLMVGLFVALYIIEQLKPKLDATSKQVDMKAEFVITMTWPDKAFDDIDLHLLLPSQQSVNFSSHDTPFATLDRDDTGAGSDLIKNPDGTETLIELNHELLTIRSIVPGLYVVNVHVFHAFPSRFINKQYVNSQNPLPYNARISLQKLNPVMKDIVTVDVPLSETGQQKTAFSFIVEPDGSISNVNKEADIPFIQTRPVYESSEMGP